MDGGEGRGEEKGMIRGIMYMYLCTYHCSDSTENETVGPKKSRNLMSHD